MTAHRRDAIGLFVVLSVATALFFWRMQAIISAPPPRQQLDVYFSPKGGAEAAIVAEIVAARQTILIQAYSFTSKPILAALLAAHERGVDVTVCCDDGANKNPAYTIADDLQSGGIKVYLDHKHAISHSKTMVLDGKTVLTGSYNWTGAAETSNLENLLVIRDERLAGEYRENWTLHRRHSVERKHK